MKKKSNIDLPIIFIFELENTIIGNTFDYIHNYKKFNDFIIDNCKNNRSTYLCNINSWTDDLDKNLIRPYFKEFIEEIKIKFPTAEFYIYSLYNRAYINYLIEFLEKNINVKFIIPEVFISNKNYRMFKDIRGYTDEIIKSLNKKINKKDIDIILNDRTIIIDNNKENWINEYRHIIPKSYNYTPLIEINKDMLIDIYNIKDDYLKNYMNTNLNNNLPIITPEMSLDEFLMEYHLKMYINYKDNKNSNDEIIANDNFFKLLLDKIKTRSSNNKLFGETFLIELQKEL